MNRIERMEYLYAKAAAEQNPEQKEAYLERLDKHWQQHLDNLEKRNK